MTVGCCVRSPLTLSNHGEHTFFAQYPYGIQLLSKWGTSIGTHWSGELWTIALVRKRKNDLRPPTTGVSGRNNFYATRIISKSNELTGPTRIVTISLRRYETADWTVLWRERVRLSDFSDTQLELLRVLLLFNLPLPQSLSAARIHNH